MKRKSQSELFNNILNKYKDNYYDQYSNFYRNKVILSKIKKFCNFKKSILEVGCGGGSNYMIFQKNNMISGSYYAIDISEKCVEDFNKMTINNENAFAYLVDFTEKNLNLNQTFDVILFMGVLHHMTNDLDVVMDNINKHLKLEGIVIFSEPNANFLNSIRKIWYKLSDDFDHENERALTIKEIDYYAERKLLKNISFKYFGNLGFFIILQSMIIRTPKFIKHITYKFLTYFDLLLERIQSKYHLAAMIIIYKKTL